MNDPRVGLNTLKARREAMSHQMRALKRERRPGRSKRMTEVRQGIARLDAQIAAAPRRG